MRSASPVSDQRPQSSGAESADKPLTVLQVLPRLEMGGVERGALEIARAVVEARGRALVAVEPGGRLAMRMDAAGAERIEGSFASKNPLTIRANAARLAAIIRDEGVDVIHARSRAPAWSAWMAARRTGAPFITTWHGVYGERGPFKRLYNSVMGKGDRVIAVSEFIAETVRRYGVEDARIAVIPRGADMAVFSDEAVHPSRTVQMAEAFRVVEDSRPIVMLPGRLSGWKGQEDFIDAAARLKAEIGPDFLALIVGDGPRDYADRLTRRIMARGAQDVARLTGPCDDMPAAYKLASVVVSASTDPEAFGRVAVESQAMGRPIIATNHGGACETVADGVSGWLYPPGDIEALAAAMKRALALDESARAQMGMAGRARAASRYSVATMQRATLRLYEELAGRIFGAPQ